MNEQKIEYFLVATTAGVKIKATKKGKGFVVTIKEEDFGTATEVLEGLKRHIETALKK